jgi:membrane protease YdiL (CAAX protease family)
MDPESSAIGLLKRFAASVKIPNCARAAIWLLGSLLYSLFVDVPVTVFTIAQLPLVLFNIVVAPGEEIGWMGYAFDFMEEKWQTLNAAIIIGVLWGLWHAPLFYAVGNSLMWLFVFIINFVAWRILIVWIYKNTGNSIFAVSVFHAIGTYPTSMLPYMQEPSGGVLGMIVETVVTIIAALIVVTLGKLKQ